MYLVIANGACTPNMCTSRGEGAELPQSRAEQFFGTIAKFFGQNPATQNGFKKKIFIKYFHFADTIDLVSLDE